jgi:hypothetical protein
MVMNYLPSNVTQRSLTPLGPGPHENKSAGSTAGFDSGVSIIDVVEVIVIVNVVVIIWIELKEQSAFRACEFVRKRWVEIIFVSPVLTRRASDPPSDFLVHHISTS